MTVQAAATRLAGKALGDFLKVGAGALSGAAQRATFDYLKGQAGAGGLIGKVAAHPETVSKLAGAAAPIAAAGATAAGAGLISSMMQPPGGIYANSAYSLPVQPSAAAQRQAAFSSQQYMPGVAPLTNLQMGEALLDQQRFQHQLQLIQARQAASGGAGGLNPSGGVNDIMALASRIYG